jgi:steroid delta-isomerase-like uncharacterized protein
VRVPDHCRESGRSARLGARSSRRLQALGSTQPDRGGARPDLCSYYDRVCETTTAAVSEPDGEARMETADELFDAWEDAWSDKDPDAFRQVCSPHLHYEDPLTTEPLEGIPALITHAERLWQAFPDARLEQLGPRLVDGRMAAAPSKLLATHREPLGGLPATGRFIVLPMVTYCELEGGRLLRVRAFFDLYDAAVQLGALPSRGSLGEKALLMLRGFGLRGGR